MLTRALASLAALRHRPARARAFVRPTMRLHLAVLGLLASCAVPAGAMESRFGRKIDLDVLEADMLVGEEPDDNNAFVMERGDDGKLHPTGEAIKPKPEMAFVTLKPEFDTKEKTEEVAEKWTSLLWTNGLQVRPFPIDDNRLLIVVDTGLVDVDALKSFVLTQEEIEIFEYKQQQYRPGDAGGLKGDNGIDMAKVQRLLKAQGISMDDTPARKKKNKNKLTRRQKRERKKKRKEEQAAKRREREANQGKEEL